MAFPIDALDPTQIDQIKTLISQLVAAITAIVREAIDSGVEPEEELLFQWKCNDFKYSEKGAESSGSTGGIRSDLFRTRPAEVSGRTKASQSRPGSARAAPGRGPRYPPGHRVTLFLCMTLDLVTMKVLGPVAQMDRAAVS